MAASDVDQKILGRIAKQTARTNPLLSSSLYQLLGLSIILTRKLFRARRTRKLDPSRDSKSLSLYHQIIWLSREGLSLTEVYILPYCQDGEQGAECRVMAAKLRASFYHVFCLFHNHPSLNQLSLRSSPEGMGKQEETKKDSGSTSHLRVAGLRDPIPSMTSESSYVTNPFAGSGPAQSPPPSYPIPPIPTTPSRRAPTRPPGLMPATPTQRSSPSSATFLLPPLNFVPSATNYFSIAASLASKLLSASDPLRLSVALEHSAFLHDCVHDAEASRRRARDAIRAVYEDEGKLSDAEFEDATALVQALATLSRRTSGSGSSASKSSQKSRNATRYDSKHGSMVAPRDVPTPSLPPKPTQYEAVSSLTPEPAMGLGLSGIGDASATLVGSPATVQTSSETKTEQDVSSNSASRRRSRRRLEGSGSDKERKRRAVQRAEEELMRSGSSSNKSGPSETDTVRRIS